jgi:hypothetical protein
VKFVPGMRLIGSHEFACMDDREESLEVFGHQRVKFIAGVGVCG